MVIRRTSALFRSGRVRGLTLVEIMVAVALLAISATGTLSTLVFCSKMARLNSNAVAAKNIAQGYFEQMYIDTFENINAANYPNIPYPTRPYSLTMPNAVWLDRGMLMPCRIQFEFKGFGVLEGGSVGLLTDDDADWKPNEWAGDTVFIVSGSGAGQFGEIKSNTPSTLTLKDSLFFAPGGGSRYMINNGKTVEVTTTWEYKGKPYQQTIESLISNYRNDGNLGF